MRLLMRPNRRDVGEALPLTQAAWELPEKTPEQSAQRVQALVSALEQERLIVPVTVEADPEDPDHKPLDPRTSPLQTTDSPYGSSVVAFTSADELFRWDPKGRPMTMKSFRVAVAAVASTDSETITLNPGSKRRTIIPRPAVLALAAGDAWLPAWDNPELVKALKARAQEASPGVVGLKLRPAAPYGSGSWDGGVAVDLYIDPQKLKGSAGPAEGKASLAAAMKAVSTDPMLKEAAQSVELVPRPVAGA